MIISRSKLNFTTTSVPKICVINFIKFSVGTDFNEISVIFTGMYWNLLEFTGIFDLKNPVELETTGNLKLYWN